jgi:hypothetical protein
MTMSAARYCLSGLAGAAMAIAVSTGATADPAVIVQTGDYNLALFETTADSDILLFQRGGKNDLTATQSGGNIALDAYQFSSHNKADITQHGKTGAASRTMASSGRSSERIT